MKIENLKEGMIIKNYGALCELLEIDKKLGDSKKSQMKQLERYIRYSKQGHKFVIDKIYETPMVMVDGRADNGANRKVYINYIERILADLVYENDGLFISTNNLLTILGMTNSNYAKMRRREENLTALLKQGLVREEDTKFLNNFFNRTHSMFKYDIDSALKSLENRKIIDIEKGRAIIEHGKKPRRATPEEREIILEAEFKALKKLDREKFSEVIAFGEVDDYNSLVINQINKKIENLYMYYTCYDIILAKGATREDIDKIGLANINKNNVNEEVQIKIIKNAEDKVKRAYEKIEKGDFFNGVNITKTDLLATEVGYIEATNNFVDAAIKIE